jgi:hypothetical protein
LNFYGRFALENHGIDVDALGTGLRSLLESPVCKALYEICRRIQAERARDASIRTESDHRDYASPKHHLSSRETAGDRLGTTKTALPKKKRLNTTMVTSDGAARKLEAYLETGINVTRFATRCNTTDRTLRTFRAGGNINRDLLSRVAREMGTTAEELLK